MTHRRPTGAPAPLRAVPRGRGPAGRACSRVPCSSGCRARAAPRRALLGRRSREPRRRAADVGHPHAGRPRADHDQRHRRGHRAVDHRHRPRRRRSASGTPAPRRCSACRGPRSSGKRSIVDFHLPEELEAEADDGGSAAGLAALVHAAQEHGSDVRDWTYVAADGRTRTVVGRDHPAHRRRRRARRLELRRHRHDRGPRHRADEGPVRQPDQPRAAHAAHARSWATWSSSSTTRTSRSPTSSAQYLTTVERNAHRLLRLVGDLLFTAQVDAGRFTPAARGRRPGRAWCAPPRRPPGSPRRPPASRSSSTCPDAGLVVPGDAVRLGPGLRQPGLQRREVHAGRRAGDPRPCARAWRDAGRHGRATDPRPGAVPVAQLAVSDTGIGIPAGEQGKLFTRFFRASTARRNAVPGVGLGPGHHQGDHHRARRHAGRRQRRGRGHHLHPHRSPATT